MTRLHMNAQRRSILRVMLATDGYLYGSDIARRADLPADLANRALRRFEEKQWVIAEDQGVYVQRQRRRFKLNPDARLSIEVVLEGWSFEAPAHVPRETPAGG